MKNNKFLMLFILIVCFLSVKEVKAVRMTMTRTIPYNGEILLVNSVDYGNLTCNIVESSYHTIYADSNNNYHARWKPGAVMPASNVESKVNCSYSAYYLAGENTPGTIEITMITPLLNRDYNLSISLQNGQGYKYMVDMVAEKYLSNFQGIVSSRVISGNEYIASNCSANDASAKKAGNTCIFQVPNGMKSYDGVKEAVVEIKYIDSSSSWDNPRKVEVHFYITSSLKIIASAGGYGKCNFDSSWNNVNGSYSKKYDGGAITLPTCDASSSSNPLLEFYGWIYAGGEAGPETRVDMCVNGGNNIKVSGSVTPSANGIYNYYSCYRSVGGIVLNANGASVTRSGVIEKNGIYYIKTSTNVNLPTAAEMEMPAAWEGRRLVGWVNTRTGGQVQPGASVEADGTEYRAVYVNGGEEGSTPEVTQGLVYEGETSSFGSDLNLVSCTTDRAIVEVYVQNGGCFVRGKNGRTGEIATVTAYDQNGLQYIKRYNVMEREGVVEWGDIDIDNPGNVEAGEVIYDDTGDGTTDNPGVGDGTSTQGKPQMCNSYTYVGGNVSRDVATYGSNYTPMHIWTYRMTKDPSCGGTSTVATLCLDPGWPSPKGSDHYVVSKEYKNNTNSKWGKFLNFLVKKLMRETPGETAEEKNTKILDVEYSDKIAANIALRIMSFEFGINRGAAGGNYYHAFPAALQAYKKDGKISGAWNVIDTAVINKAEEYMNEFASSGDESYETEADVTNESTEEAVLKSLGGSKYQVETSGKVTLPEGASLTKLACTSNGGYTCNVTRTNTDPRFVEYKVNVVITDITSVLSGTTDGDSAIKILVSYDSPNSVGRVSMLEDVTTPNSQRMIVFDASDTTVGVPLKIKISCLSPLPELDYEAYCDASGNCSAPFDMDLFQSLDCCKNIPVHSGTEFYNKYCDNLCYSTDYELLCDNNNSEANDFYYLHEGKDPGDGDKYTCVVDTYATDLAASRTHTNNMTDALGNDYSMKNLTDFNNKRMENNEWCRISCKEDWGLSTYGYKNFTKDNAVAAGEYFAVDDDLYIYGSRTCVTTFIDYDGYLLKIQKLTDELVDNYNVFSVYAAVREAILNGTVTYTYPMYWGSGSSHHVEYCDKYCSDGKGGSTVCGSYKCVDHYDYTSMIGPSTEKHESFSGTATIYTNYEGNVTGTVSVSGSLSTEDSEPNNGGHIMFEEGDDCSASAGHPGDTEQNMKDMAIYTYGYGSVPSQSRTVISAVQHFKSEVDRIYGDIQRISREFASCQNFNLYNPSGVQIKIDGHIYEEKNINSGDVGTYITYDDNKIIYTGTDKLDITAPGTVTIPSPYEPTASYHYEEKEYMAMLGINNILVPAEERNAEKGADYSANVVECVEVDGSYKIGSSTDKVKLCKNFVTTNTYSVGVKANAWKKDSADALTYTNVSGGTSATVTNTGVLKVAGTTYNTESAGTYDGAGYTAKRFALCRAKYNGNYTKDAGNSECQHAIVYYYQANYIKQTIENSSFYHNKGHWWLKKTTDIKTHSDTKQQAAGKYGDVEENWTKFGKTWNTFPVQLDTRRNYYQYWYKYGTMGVFNNKITSNKVSADDATKLTGRVMGTSNKSLLQNNSHTCYYEVYEQLCHCCGDMIDTYVTYPACASTEECMNSQGIDDYSQSDPYADNNGALSVMTTPVTLDDITYGGRTLGANWSSNSSYLFENQHYTTTQGEELKDLIQSGGTYSGKNPDNNIATVGGNNIYNGLPEYSYTLTPNALSNIKSYNDSHSYEVSVKNLTLVDGNGKNTTCMEASKNPSGCDEFDIQFAHYGSNFLIDFMKDYATEGVENLTERRNICVVSNVQGLYSIMNDSTKNCRWIDYITSSGHQLAFK